MRNGSGGLRRGLVTAVTTMVALAVGVTPAVAGAAPAAKAATTGPTATVTGPLTGGKGQINLTAPGVDLAPGYVGEEYVVSGTATSYRRVGTFGADGVWKVKPADRAPYTTRIVVYRPADPAAFNGTVFVEWLNVSAGFESAPDWGSGHTAIARAGAAWVGVSAQAVGVQGGTKTVAGVAPGGLKAADPERYGMLSHPGDAYSYDMFTQIGRAVAGNTGAKPLGDLQVKRVIALGESQSAFRLVTYVNAVHPLVDVYDGFLIHSRSASASGLTSNLDRRYRDKAMPKVARIRPTNVPVFTVQTESDLLLLGYLPARQPDAKRFRLWEVAGTSHADAYTGLLGFTDRDDGTTERTLLDPTKVDGGPLQCRDRMNSGPGFAVLGAALVGLDRWVQTGTPPPKAPRLKVTTGAKTKLVRDAHGNARGGVRTPMVDVPVARLAGDTNGGGKFCALFGTTTPFDAATLRSLYPTTEEYVAKFDAATDAAVAAGFLLPQDAAQFQAAAPEIGVPPSA